MILLASFVVCEAERDEDFINDKKSSGSDVQNEVCIGIDLGTTYSCIAAVNKSGASSVEILDLGRGKTTLPSVVKYNPYKDPKTNQVRYIPKTGWEVYLENIRKPSPN